MGCGQTSESQANQLALLEPLFHERLLSFFPFGSYAECNKVQRLCPATVEKNVRIEAIYFRLTKPELNMRRLSGQK